MTRRKRTPSPAAHRRRVNFEIPASLQHLSALSRSLAEQADTISSSEQEKEDPANTSQHKRFEKPWPEIESTHTQAPTQSSLPQRISSGVNLGLPKPQLSDPRHWPQSQARKAVPLPVALPSDRQPLSTQTWLQPQTSTTTQRQASTQSVDTLQNMGKEPLANPGETLSLVKHPNQIAAMIAKKRAENEIQGNRQRWLREQAAHFKSKTPDKSPVPQTQVPSSDSRILQHSKTTSTKANVPSKPAQDLANLKEKRNTTPLPTQNYRPQSTNMKQPSWTQNIDNIPKHHVSSSSRYSGPISSSPVPENPTGDRHRMTNSTSNANFPARSTVSLHNRTNSNSSIPHNVNRADILTEGPAIPPLFSDRPRSKPLPGLQSLPSQSSLEHPVTNSSFSDEPAPPPSHLNNQIIPNVSAGYYKIDPRLWSSPSSDGLSMSPSNFIHSTPILTSSTNTTYWNTPTRPTSYYNNSAPTGAGYGSFSHGGGMSATFRNATQDAFSVPKR